MLIIINRKEEQERRVMKERFGGNTFSHGVPPCPQVECPTRTTNRSLINLTTNKGFSPEDVYKVG